MLGQFQWKRVGAEWRLSHDRRQVGRVVPDSKYPDMWRVKLPGGLSDMVNLSRARDAARERAAQQVERLRNAAETEKNIVRNQEEFSGPSPQAAIRA